MPYVARSQFHPRLRGNKKRTKSSNSDLLLSKQRSRTGDALRDKDTAWLFIKHTGLLLFGLEFVWWWFVFWGACVEQAGLSLFCFSVPFLVYFLVSPHPQYVFYFI